MAACPCQIWDGRGEAGTGVARKGTLRCLGRGMKLEMAGSYGGMKESDALRNKEGNGGMGKERWGGGSVI